MKKKILATSWHPGGMNAIVPVIKRLNKEKKVELLTIGHQYSEGILDSQGIDYKKITDYGLNDVSTHSMEELLRKELPKLVLTGTSAQNEDNRDVIEQTITLAAKRIGIKSLAVLDFWGNYSLRFNDIYTGEHFKFLPDKIAIMDKYAEKDMLNEGFDKDKLVITGNPHFDNLESKARNFTETEKKDIRKKIGLNVNVLLFYAGNVWKKKKKDFGYWDLDNIQLVEEVLNDLAQQGKKSSGMVVKLHPRVPTEDLKEITQYIDEHSKEKMVLVKNIGPQELVLASDLTLTPYSTVGIEAVYMGKPCISIQPGLREEDYLAILTKNKLIHAGYTKEDCKKLVEKVIIDDDYREKELIEKASSFRTDGKATERVTNLVYEMLAHQ